MCSASFRLLSEGTLAKRSPLKALSSGSDADNAAEETSETS